MKERVTGVTFNSAPLGVSGLQVSTAESVAGAARIVNFRLSGDVVSGLHLNDVGPVIEMELSRGQLWVRKPGILGDLDPVMHSMSLVEKAILLHPNSDVAPADWV